VRTACGREGDSALAAQPRLIVAQKRGHLALEHIEGLVLRMGVNRGRGTVRELTVPERESPAGLLSVELDPRERAEEPERLDALVGHVGLRAHACAVS
jgi:hypothetical protein